MSHPRRFRFGLQASQPFPGLSWADTARQVESAGFSTLFVPDHFGDQLSPISAITAAACATTSLRVGALVFDNDYRHPVVLASEIATVDRLSEGRVEFGLGSGWKASDYEQSGMSYDPPKVRVDRFVEAVEIIRRFWSNDLVDFEGEYYTITALDGLPKPHQPGGPPLLIGAGGPRMLRFAGAHADIVGVNPSIHSGRVDAATARDAGADRFDQKLRWVREGAGDRFDDIELNVLIFMVTVTDDAASVAANVAPMFGVETDDFLNMPPVLCGTEGEICAQLETRRERWGLSYSVVQAASFEAMTPIVARMAGQ